MINANEVNVEKPLVSYRKRLFPANEILSVAILAALLLYILYVRHFSLEALQKNAIALAVVMVYPFFYAFLYYRNVWQPGQYYVTRLHTDGAYIYITAAYRNDPPVETKYYYKDVEFKTRAGRNRQFFLVIKTAPEGTIGDYKTKYTMGGSGGWKRKEIFELLYQLQEWRKALEDSNASALSAR